MIVRSADHNISVEEISEYPFMANITCHTAHGGTEPDLVEMAPDHIDFGEGRVAAEVAGRGADDPSHV